MLEQKQRRFWNHCRIPNNTGTADFSFIFNSIFLYSAWNKKKLISRYIWGIDNKQANHKKMKLKVKNRPSISCEKWFNDSKTFFFCFISSVNSWWLLFFWIKKMENKLQILVDLKNRATNRTKFSNNTFIKLDFEYAHHEIRKIGQQTKKNFFSKGLNALTGWCY